MRIGILGAGLIGCFLGGVLARTGCHPVLVGRESMAKRIAGGYRISDHLGMSIPINPGEFTIETIPEALADCGHVLLCVKSTNTRAAASSLAGILPAETVVTTFQNGVSNAAILRNELPDNPIARASVGFNVAMSGDNCFHRGTDGEVILESHENTNRLGDAFKQGGLPVRFSDDMEAVLWGKLILNLNNAVNALSGLPLKRQLSQRSYRLVFAASIREALAAMDRAGIEVAKVGAVGPRLIPPILGLPDPLFRIVAGSMLRIDDKARSSMAEDLDKGREPEIDWINGEVVALGKSTGVATPVNERLVDLVRRAHAKGRTPAISGPALLKETGMAGGD